LMSALPGPVRGRVEGRRWAWRDDDVALAVVIMPVEVSVADAVEVRGVVATTVDEMTPMDGVVVVVVVEVQLFYAGGAADAVDLTRVEPRMRRSYV